MAEGYRVVGFDLERHVYGEARYPAQLVLQDVRTLHGRQFKDAALIVASPPCQAFSYMAMPWTKAKQIAREYRDGTRDVRELTALFDACFRIQREACEAAGRHIPLVVENVCGAQKWVGRARWHYGSFYLWGDVPALMPIVRRGVLKRGVAHREGSGETNFHQTAAQRAESRGIKAGDRNKARASGGHEWTTGFDKHTKNDGGSWFNVAHNTTSGKGQNPDGRKVGSAVEETGVKQGGDWFNNSEPSISRLTGSKSSARKAASAHIAKIPLALAAHIARAWKPDCPAMRGKGSDRGED